MGHIAEAMLADGTKIQYVIVDNPPNGSMKHTYFTPDKSRVVQFFNNPDTARDPERRARLEAIIGRFNPTRAEENGGATGTDEAMARYFSKVFCWPTAIVTQPEFGIVCPAYPPEFVFSENASTSPALSEALRGKDKKSSWFTSAKNRKYMRREELGDFRNMLKIAISLARAVRKMHLSGLTHSDLSCNNVLINPKTGSCVIIDIDSLMVPGLYPPEVIGTDKYIAPEIIESDFLPYSAPEKKMPCSDTDSHALAVLIYEYLLLRHPLEGPKSYSDDPIIDDSLCMGSKALFIEDPYDRSNRPRDLHVTIKDLGPDLERLFIQAFVDGLHDREKRPTAMDWETALLKAWDLLQPCGNPRCEAKWFILHDVKRPICPFCGKRIPKDAFLRLRLSKPVNDRNGQWRPAGEVNVYPNMPLFRWHMQADVFPNEKADTHVMAYIYKEGSRWLLANRSARGMTAPDGSTVPTGRALVLRRGTAFRLCGGENGLLAEVSR